MQNPVMLEIVQQCRRHALGTRRHEHSGAGHPCGRIGGGSDEHLDRHHPFLQTRNHQLATLGPGRQKGEGNDRHDQREPAALWDLDDVRRQKGAIDDEEQAGEKGDAPGGPLPDLDHQNGDQAGSDEHRPDYREPVGGQQVGRFAEGQDDQDDQRQQHPIDRRNVDLAERLFTGVDDAQARHQTQLNGLLDHRESTGDQGLAGDDGGERGEDHERKAKKLRRHQEERIFDRAGIAQDHCALAEVIEDKRRKHDAHPGQGNGFSSKMPHVCVQRLGSGDRQYHRAERQKGEAGVANKECNGMVRRQSGKDAGIRRDVHDPEDSQHQKIE